MLCVFISCVQRVVEASVVGSAGNACSASSSVGFLGFHPYMHLFSFRKLFVTFYLCVTNPALCKVNPCAAHSGSPRDNKSSH